MLYQLSYFRKMISDWQYSILDWRFSYRRGQLASLVQNVVWLTRKFSKNTMDISIVRRKTRLATPLSLRSGRTRDPQLGALAGEGAPDISCSTN